jgi:thiamine biosynthesis protein ThiC
VYIGSTVVNRPVMVRTINLNQLAKHQTKGTKDVSPLRTQLTSRTPASVGTVPLFSAVGESLAALNDLQSSPFTPDMIVCAQTKCLIFQTIT